MPIYAYRCDSCGFTKDALQKVSDAPLTVCPSCEKSTFKKQLTAAGFQLKGTGWYVTDFKNGGGSTASPASSPAPAAESASCSPACGTSCGASDTKSAA